VRAPSDIGRTGRGLLAGLITAAVAVGVGQLIAGIGRPQGSPVAAVGSMAIDFTPPAVKNFAISAFGGHDKLVLVSGILVLLAVFAACIGVLAIRRFAYGLAGLAVFAVIGVTAALTRPDAILADAVPTLVAAAAGAFALYRLVRAAAAESPQERHAGTAAVQPAPPPRPGLPRQGPASLDWTPQAPADPAQADPAQADPAQADPAQVEPAQAEPAQAEPARMGPDDPPLAAPPTRRTGWTGARTPVQSGRRSFLVTSAWALGAAGVSALAGRALAERSSVSQARSAVRLPAPASPPPLLPAGYDLKIKGLSSFITPNNSFYRVDTALILPEVSPQSWRLRIHGMVEREIDITFAELLKRPLIEDYITLTCVSNPVAGPYIGNAKWLGASLAALLRAARVRGGADQLLCTSTDGFTSGTPIEAILDGRDALLAVAMNGTALPVAHGFPVRMVTPGLYGYVSATKWVTDIKVTTFAAEQAYWPQRGWSQQAPIKTESRIDVPSGGGSLAPGRTPVAGVAWAQHKGIDAVHVRVDQGPWQQARLAAVPGIDTWRQWVWEWDATPGTHLLEARATDATGYTQTGAQAAPEPNGASGYPIMQVNVRSQ
jgi:DMSO/TMAO reductase YedYZ molybdopterin-dependent catalytic subunit